MLRSVIARTHAHMNRLSILFISFKLISISMHFSIFHKSIIGGFYLIGFAVASLSISPIYRDGAVIQTGPKTTVWGWTTATGDVTLSIDGNLVGQGTIPSNDDPRCRQKKWVIEFSTENISDGPHVITVSANGEQPVEAKDIYFGNVIVCSGQSNMALGSFEGVVKDTDLDSLIRLYGFSLDKDDKGCMLDENPPVNYWKADTMEITNLFASVCFFMAGSMKRTLGKPVGILRTVAPGRDIDAFLPGGFVYENMLTNLPQTSAYAIVHYQGESDSSMDRAPQYEDKLLSYVNQTRQIFRSACKNSDIVPFGIVQLPGPWTGSDENAVRMIMDTQMRVGNSIPRGFVAVSQNLTSDSFDLHPKTGKDRIGLLVGDILSARFQCAI